MKVKICGITNIDDALYCANLGADALGFIFYKKSPRFIKPKTVSEIINELPPFISTVGVFVNENISVVNEISNKLQLSYVQIHGDESPVYLNQINVPSIKAFRISKDFDFDSIYNYNSKYYLLDAFKPTEYGGTGTTFNWRNIPSGILAKTILAGGISSDNLEIIMSEIKPAAIDVSSNLEKSPGIKDHKKISEFFKTINKLENRC